METRANMPTKILSLFLSVLMAFSCFSIALPNLVPDASAADIAPVVDTDKSSYTKAEVLALLNAAVAEYNANGVTQNSDNTFIYKGSYSMLLAADAVISYAFTTIAADGAAVSGSSKVVNNTGTLIANKVISDLGISGTQATLVRAILSPSGNTEYGLTAVNPTNYSNMYVGASTHTGSWVASGYDEGEDVSNNDKVKWDEIAADAKTGYTKTATIELTADALNKYLLSFDTIESVPKKIPTRYFVKYAYAYDSYGVIHDKSALTNYYTRYSWNYLRDVDSKVRAKDSNAKKQITKFIEYFDADVLTLTYEEMLNMTAEDVYNYWLVATEKVSTAMSFTYSQEVYNHFMQAYSGYTYADVQNYIAALWDAYNVLLVKNSMDILLEKTGTDYSEWSYAEMLALHGELKAAKDVFDTLQSNAEYKAALQYVVTNYPEYVEKYNSIAAMDDAVDTYIQELYDTMRLQRLRETLQTMEDTYDANWEYVKDEEAINTLDDLDTNQVAAILDKSKALSGILSGEYDFTNAEINAMLAEINADVAEGDVEFTLANWNTFVANLEAKLATRDDEVIYKSYFDYFYPYVMQDFTGLSNDELMDLHKNAQYEYNDLVEVYNEFVAVYGKEWTDELFSIDYNGEKVLLQDAISQNYTQNKSVLELYMRERNAAQLNAIAAYPTGLKVDFTNYAQLKSVLVHFDEDFYQYCLATNVTWTATDKDGNEEERSLTKDNWVTSAQINIYNTQESLLASWKAFVDTDGYSAFDHTFTFADLNGNYAIRHAGSQIITEIDPEDGEEYDVELGYPNDLVRNGEDDNYYVTSAEVDGFVNKLDYAVTSRDFAALIGLKDIAGSLGGTLGTEIDPEALETIDDLASFVDVLFNEAFSDGLINTLVGAIFPMLADLLDNTLADALGGLGTPEAQWGGASAAYSMTGNNMIGDKWAGVEGTLNIFMDTDWHDHAGNGRAEGNFVHGQNDMYRFQREFPEVFADLGLNIYPRTMAKFFAEIDPGSFGPTTEFYQTLMAAGRDWSNLVAKDDPETEEDESKTLNLAWGVYDFESFTEVLGLVLDTIIPLLQTALGNVDFDESTSNAAFLYGKVKVYLVQIGANHGLAATGGLSLTIDSLNLYSKLLVPLFETLGVPSSAIPTLQGEFDGADVANAILGPVKALLDKIVAAPLTNILGMLPNLIYFLSMDSVSEIISQLVLHLNLAVSELDIKTDLSGAVGDIASLFESSLAGLISFGFDLDLGDLLDLDDMLGFNLTDLGDILNTLIGDSIALPYLDQTKIMFSSTWKYETSANGQQRVNLVAKKGDILFAILDYVMLALKQEGFISGLLGSSIDDPAILQLINSVVSNAVAHPDDIIAAIFELFMPNKNVLGEPEYTLQEMNWAQSDWSYEHADGVTSTDIVYLKYGNDWSEADANYLVDNIDQIFNEVMSLTGSDPIVISDMVKDLLGGVFTNGTITTLIELLGGFGDSPSAVINEIITNQLGVDIGAWFQSFGYLYPAETWKEDAVVIAPGSADYHSYFENVTATVDAEGVITWYYKGEALVDGDMDMFIDILCDLLDYAEIVVGFLFGGQNISVFGNLLELQGYDSYATTLGVLLEMLGVKNLPSQADFSADGESVNRGLRKMLHALAGRIDELLNSEHIIKDVLEMVPDLLYWIESDGLSVFLMNLLMPVWVIVDTVRPLVDVNVNGLLSLIVSDLLNGYSFDLNSILQFIGSGINANAMSDIEYKAVNLDIKHLTLSNIIKAVDQFMGTNLTDSGLVGMTIKGLFADTEEYFSVSGVGYRTPLTAADTITMLITGILDCLSYPAQDTQKTNGDVLCGVLAEMLEMPDLANIYPVIAEVLDGIEVVYTDPDWAYMGDTDDEKQDIVDAVKNGTFAPVPSIGYLAYQTDWSEPTAKGVYNALKGVLNQFLPDLLGDMGSSIADVVNNLLMDNLYSDEMMDSIAIMICDLLAQIEGLLGVVDVLLGTSVVDLIDFVDIRYEYVPVLDANGNLQYEKATNYTDKYLTRYTSYFDDDLGEYVYEEATPEEIANPSSTLYVVVSDFVYETDENGDFVLDEDGKKIPKCTINCTKDWGIDAAQTVAEKQAAFLAGASEIIRPLNSIFGWLFFGDDYRFFTASKGEYAENGEIVYKEAGDVLVLSGGHGYTMGLVPILEALGFRNLATEAECYDAATGTYDATVAIRSIFEAAIDLVNRADADPMAVVFDIVANLIYFLNANGIGSSIENLLAPVLGYLDIVDAFVEDDFSINGLLSMLLGFDINVTYPEGHPKAGHINLTLAKILEMLPGFLGGSLPLVISEEIEDIILSLYVGKLSAIEDSAAYWIDGTDQWTSYRLNVAGCEYHVITILISLVLDLAKSPDNRTFIVDLLGGEEKAGKMYDAIIAIVSGMDVNYVDINWEYMYETKDEEGNVTNEEAAKQQLADTVANNTVIAPSFVNPYLAYNTNWDSAAATEVYDFLGTLLQDLLPDLIDAESLAAFVDAMLNDNVYSNDLLNMVIELVTNLLGDFKDYLALADALLETDVAAWFEYCEQVEETTYVEATEEQKADETVTKYNKVTEGEAESYVEAADGTYVAETEMVWKVKADLADWGFNKKDADNDGDIDNDDNQKIFIDAVVDLLSTADGLLAWLFFGKDLTLFNGSKVVGTDENGEPIYEVLITLNGGNGYEEAIVPLLEMLLGCVGADGKSTLFTAEDCYDAEKGIYRTSEAIGSILRALLAFVDEVSANPVDEVFELLPNLFYFLNSDGFVAVVNNLIAPVAGVLTSLGAFGVDFDITNLIDGLDITNLTTDELLEFVFNMELLADLKISDNMLNIFKYFYHDYKMMSFTSANGETAYRVVTAGYEKDTLTTLVSFVLDLATLNPEFLAGLIGEDYEEVIKTIITLIKGVDVTYTDMNWGYMYEDNAETEINEALQQLDAAVANKTQLVPSFNNPYLKYNTNWNQESSKAVYELLEKLLQDLLPDLIGAESLAAFVDAMLTENVYSNDILNMVIELITNLLADFEQYLVLADKVLDTNTAAWFALCDKDAEGNYVRNEDGDLVCTKDWGFGEDAAANQEIFINAVVELLAPADALLNWLFFGKDITLFTSSAVDANGEYTLEPVITLAGGKGYEMALVPLLEAILGLDENGKSLLPTAVECANNTSAAIGGILRAVLAFVDKVSADPVNSVFELLPNLFYFLNSNGAVVVVNNLLAPVKDILGALGAFGVNLDLTTIVPGLDITNITTDAVLDFVLNMDLLKDEEGNALVTIPDAMLNIFKYFYHTYEVTSYTSANTLKAYRIVTKTDAYNYNKDTLTTLVSFVLDLAVNNPEFLAGLLGEDYETMIKTILELIKGMKVEYKPVEWITELDATFDNPYLLYSTDWSKPTADKVYAALKSILEKMLPGLLSDEEDASLKTIIEGILVDNVYTDEILVTVIELLANLVGDFAEYLGVADALLGTNTDKWFKWCEKNADGEWVCTKNWGIDAAQTTAEKQEAFIAAIVEVLSTADGLLNWLFFGKSITLFNTYTGDVQITLNGGNGYAEALVPLLEAIFGLDKDGKTFLYTPAQCNNNTSTAIEGILRTVLAFVDKACADPVKTVFEIIPNLFYFIDSNGLVAVVNNLLAPAAELLDKLEAFGVEIDLSNLVEGLDILNLTRENLVKFLEGIIADTGIVIAPELMNILLGFYNDYSLVEFTSANGKQAYRVDAANHESDLLTTLVSLVLDVAVTNKAFVVDLLGGDEEAEKIFDTILKVIKGYPVTYVDMNWAGYDNSFINPYLAYTTNWDEETADKIYAVLTSLLNEMLPGLLSDEEDASLKKIIEGILVDNVYTDDILVTVIELLTNLVGDFAEYLGVADALLGTDTAKWFAWCEKNADGEFVCTKNWGIDDAATVAEKQELFIKAIVEVLATADGLLNWLFFGDSITLFNTYTGGTQITLNGGKGYEMALVPLLEALFGLDANGNSLLYTAEQCNNNTSKAIEGILRAVLAFVDKACANPVKTVFELLPNLFYFIESDGLVVVVNNLLAPAKDLLAELKNIGVDFDLNTLVDGLEITNLTTENLLKFLDGILADNNIVVPDAMMDILLYFYNDFELVEYTSANGKQAYRVDITGNESIVLTTLVSFVLDLAVANKAFVVDLLGGDAEAEEMYATILNLIKGVDVTYTDMSWASLDETFVNPYLAYTTNWTEETANKVYTVLVSLLEEMLPGLLSDEEDASLKKIIEGILADNVYTDDILVTVIELLANLVGDFAQYLGVADALLGTDTAKWFAWCEKNAEGEFVCTKDWGIDEAATIAEKQELFIKAIVEVLATADGLLNWLFFGDSITLFNTYTGGTQITLNGGKGYETALVPLLEALFGCVKTVDGKTVSTLYTAAECGNNTSKAIEGILRTVLAFVDKACANPVKTVFELLPNLFYFIESNGLVVVVNNLLAPAKEILAELSAFGVELDLNTLVDGLELTNLTTENLLKFLDGILADNNIVVPEEMMDILLGFYNDFTLTSFTSANLKTAYRVDITGNESIVLTTLVSFVLDLAVANEAFVVDLLGGDEEAEEMYATILNIIKGYDVTYVDMNWAPIDNSFNNPYVNTNNTSWTKETADKVYTVLVSLLEEMLPGLLSDEEDASLKKIIEGILVDNVYTDEILVTVIELLANLVGDFAEYLGVADALLGTNTAEWFKWCEKNADGEWVCTKDWGVDNAQTVADKQDKFIAAIVEVLSTADGLLNWLFFGDSITLFNTYTGDVQITLNGGKGYETALVPLLEAILGVDANNETFLYTAEECDGNTSKAIEGILKAVLGFVDKACANPVKTVFEILPNLFYFIESDGLVVVVNNLLAPAKEILNELKAFGVDLDLNTLVDGLDLTNLTTANLVKFLNGILADNNIVVPKDMMNILLGFYNGFKAVEFTSANGKQAYRVDITGNESIVLTTLVSFVLDLAVANEAFVIDLLGGDAEAQAMYDTILNIIRGYDVTYVDMDWAAIDSTFENPYLKGNTNWTQAAADEVYALLVGILEDMLPGLLDENAEDLKTIIDGILNDNVYTDEILVTVIELLANLVGDFAEYLGVADALLGTNTAQWFKWCEKNADGEWVCTNDWKISNAVDTNGNGSNIDEKQDAFIAAIVEVLSTADGLLNWLFFGKSITLFNSYTGDVQITLNGGNGYAEALVPLLEALFGVDAEGKTLLYTPAECEGNTSKAIEGILKAVLKFVDKACANPVKTVFELLPNLFYFIESDGLVVVVNNLLAPAKEILGELKTFGVDLDLNTLVDGLELTNLTTENLVKFLNGILADNNIVIPETMMNILLGFYNDFTPVEFTSANGETAYRVDITGKESIVLTTLVSFVLDLAILNEEFVKDLLGEDNAGIYDAVVKLIAGLDVAYVDMDWAYMYADTTEMTALDKLAATAANKAPFVDNYTNVYLETYTRTDWTAETAKTVYTTLANIAVELIGSLLGEGQEDIADLVNDLLNGEVYTESNLNTILELIVNAISDFADYLKVADVVLGTSVSDPNVGWLAYGEKVTTTVTDAETGEVTTETEWVCTYDWGVDTAADDEAKKNAFLDGVKKILAPADALLAWLFFGEDITLFTSASTETVVDDAVTGETHEVFTYEPIITLNGGRGYSEALVPLLEALFGCVDENGNSTLLTEAECYDATNDIYRTSEALVGIFESALDFVDQVSDDPVAEVFELLPNLLYFINANGLSVVVNNLLAPVLGLLEYLPAFGLEIDLAELLGMEELDLSDLTLSSILKIVAGFGIEINLTDEIVTILEEFFFNAKPVTYNSARTDENGNRKTAYRVDTKGTEKDTLTTLLCLVLDLLYANKALLVDLIGSEELYDAIITILSGIDVTYVDINWAYMYEDDATTDVNEALNTLLQTGFPAVDENDIPYLKYSTDWTEEAAANVYSILSAVVDMILPSILEEGQEDLADFVFGLLSAELYNDDMLNTLVELIVNLLGDFKDYLALVDVVLGTDAEAWFDPTFVEYNEETEEYECIFNWGVDNAATEEEKKDKFLEGIAEIVDPANALLSWVFFGQSYEFFWGTASETTGSALFTLNGGHGYIEALVPLLELLGCKNLPTLEECYDEELGTYSVAKALAGIFNSALGLVQSISDNPIEVVFTLVPSLIYFINANGLSVIVNNLLAPVSSLLNSLGAFGLDVDLASLIEGLDITNITMDALLGLLSDALGITLTPEMIKILNTFFYVCEVEGYQSATGDASVRLNINGHGGDILTVILNLVLDVALYEGNAAVFADLLGEETYVALVEFLTAAKAGGYQYEDINWGFMYNDKYADSEDVIADSLEHLLINGLPERTGTNATVFEAYTLYKNNWTEEAAELLADNLSAIVEGLLGEKLGDLINNLLADGVYSDSIVNSLIELVVNLLGDFKDYLGALGIVGAEGIAEWFDYCEEVVDEETGETEWVCTKVWGIDAIEDATAKRDAFVDAFAEVLKPADRILAWLLLGEEITFFVESENSGTEEAPEYKPLITLAGGQGYAHAIAPLFELLGCVREDAYGDLYSTLPDSVGVDSMIRALLDGVVDILEDICADPVGAVLELLPNLIYFLNAGGVETVVNNLLVPVNSLLTALKGFGLEVDLNSLLAEIGLDGLTTKALLDMLSTELGITFPEALGNFFATFYIGEAVEYASVDGQTGVRLAYNDKEDAGDMLTILLSLVLDLAAYEQNEPVLVDLLGQDIYDAIMAVFEIEADDAADRYKDYTWYSTNVGEVLSPIESSGTSFEAEAAYNEIWTPEMAKFITDNLVDFATDILCLLGIKIGDMRICSLDDLVNGLLGGMLYTQEMADTILDALRDLVSAITDLEFGEPLLGIIRSALGVDIGAWRTMNVTVVDGDRDSFIAALKKILAPVVPLLDVLLCGESITLFYSYADLLSAEELEGMTEEEIEFVYANRGVVTIPGSNGYELAIAPLFEALGCIDENNVSTLLHPNSFKALSDEDKMGHIIDVLLTRVDQILEDPVNNLFTLLPGLIFFVNSNGLDTAVNNLAAGVNTVLAALTPILGEDTDGDGVKEEVSLMSLLGVELAEYNFEYLMNLLMDLLNEYITDNQLQTYLIDFVAELTTGEVVAYTSAGGKTFYTAKYASEQQLADMITIILRLAVKWVATGNNGAALIELLGVFAEDEEAAKSSAAFVNFILAALDLEYPASSMMAAVYWIFYALYTVADPAHDGYHDLNSTWSAVYDFLDEEAGPTTKNLLKVIKDFFSVDLDLDGVIDEDGIASDGALTFFEKIAAFFQKIIDFFKSLFGG